jgi:hypothetical protein
MSIRTNVVTTLALTVLFAFPSLAAAQEPRWALDLENGAVLTWYNDVRIPGNTGTRFSGRAEDILAGILVPLNRSVTLKGGYRMLEGGADNDEVYTFSGLHYAALGAIIRF